MSSRMMIRSSGSSLRSLIHRHLRPTVAATAAQTETPESIYNFQYLLPNSIVPPMVNLGDIFRFHDVGYSTTSMEAAREQRIFDPSKEEDYEDDSEMDESVLEDFDDDDDDDDDDYEDDDDEEEDDTRSGR